MIVRKVSIVECTEGWTVNGMPYQSAMSALLAVQDEDRDLAENDNDVFTIIEWTATSRVGRAVLAVLTK